MSDDSDSLKLPNPGRGQKWEIGLEGSTACVKLISDLYPHYELAYERVDYSPTRPAVSTERIVNAAHRILVRLRAKSEVSDLLGVPVTGC